MCFIVFQFQLQGGCVSKCWVQANSWFRGRNPKETLTAICSSTTAYQVGPFCWTDIEKIPLCHRKVGPGSEMLGAGSHYDLKFSVCQAGLCNLLLIKAPLKGSYSQEREMCVGRWEGGLKVCPAPAKFETKECFCFAPWSLSADLRMGLVGTLRRYDLRGLRKEFSPGRMKDKGGRSRHSANITAACDGGRMAASHPALMQHLPAVQLCTHTHTESARQ